MKRSCPMDEPHPLEMLPIDIWSYISQFWYPMDTNLIQLITNSINHHFSNVSKILWRDKLLVLKLIPAFRVAIMLSNKNIAE
jgi:hypothetical protein